MPHLLLPISPSGALLPIFIGVSASRATALKAAGQPVPNSILASGLVDTGASGICIDPSIALQLSLQAIDIGYMLTPSTGDVPQPTPIYDISLSVQHTNSSLDFDSVPAMESKLSNQGFTVLIGRNILSKCILIYDGVSGIYTLAF